MSLRTKPETIDYFKQLSYQFGILAHRNNDLMSQAKAEAFELAAFELERNMVGDINLEKVIEKQHSMEFDERNDKPLVYVCSPLAGEIEENIRKAREYSKFVAFQGNTPIAPHITELFNDTIPEERELGLSLGVDYLHKANELWVFGDRISNGMANEIKIAHDELKIPIYSVSENMNERRVFDYKKFLENEGGNISMATSKSAPLTNEQIELAKKTNLFEYVQARYQVKPHGAGTYCIVEGEHDSVILFPETNTWYDFRNEKGGDPVSFLMHHEQKAFIPAVKELLGELTDPRKVFHREAPLKKERQSMELPPKAENNSRVYAYLIKTRGLDREVVDGCVKDGSIYQSYENWNKGGKSFYTNNCIFVGHDENGEIKYASQRSLNDDSGFVFRADVVNSDKSYGFRLEGKKDAEWLRVCEAPIDVLSVASIAKLHGNTFDDEHIISLAGVSDKAIDKFLGTHDKIKVINISLDNDEPGRAAGERIKEKYTELGYKVVESYPKEKDYNLELKKEIQKINSAAIDAPNKSTNNNKAFMYLTQTKGINEEIVREAFQTNSVYQSERQNVLADKVRTVASTVFVSRDENNLCNYAIEVVHNYQEDKPDYKAEYKNEEQSRSYLSHIGKGNTLLVFNNPISMITHQTMYKLSGKENNSSYLCCLSGHTKAVSHFLQTNPNIKNVEVMLDKAISYDPRKNQNIDYRESAFSSIKKSLTGQKINVSKKYPKNIDWNKDMKAINKAEKSAVTDKKDNKQFLNEEREP